MAGQADAWFERLSLEERAAQLMAPRPRTLELSPTHYMDALAVGALIVHRDVYVDPAQMAGYVAQAQRAALARNGVPLLVCCDHEGGHIRFMRTVATTVPSNMALGAAHDPQIAADAATLLSEELLAVGVNWTLAPVVDVNNNPRNPVIGTRSYGDDPALVGAYGAAAIRAYQHAGLLACAKHFPGHGDTDVDSHIGLPRINHSRQRLQDIELAPFRDAIAAGVGSVMTAHLLVQALDPEWIGTLSSAILTDLLRNELGHHGLVVTDALEMAGVADIMPEPESAVASVKAGADVLLTGRDPAENEQVLASLVSAVRSGRLPAARFEQAVRNVLQVKERFCGSPIPDREVARLEVGSVAHRERALEFARRTITVVRNSSLPIATELGERLLVLSPLGSRRTKMEQWTFGQSPLGDEVLKRVKNARVLPIEYPVSDSARSDVQRALRSAEVAVVGLLNAIVDPDQVAFMQWLRDQAPSAVLIGVGLRTPYDAMVLPWLDNYVCAYSSVEPSIVALVEVLFGEQPARGQLPVRLQESQGDPK